MLTIIIIILFLNRIDSHGVIKVADFGLTEDMYATNYYRRRKSNACSEDKVPIRWMAPESIENDIYNESTHVVSKTVYRSHLNFKLFVCTCTRGLKYLCLIICMCLFHCSSHKLF